MDDQPEQQTYRVDNDVALTPDLMRDELLNETLFSSLSQASAVLAAWRADYNRTRPHSALGNTLPEEFAAKISLAQEAA